MRLGGPPAYWLLRCCFPRHRANASGRREHLETYLTRLTEVEVNTACYRVRDRVVVDFGCGHGEGAIELARHGEKRVIGIDIRPEVIKIARRKAAEAGMLGRCEFHCDDPDQSADTIISIDAYGHFADPAGVLESMAKILLPGGRVIASFGPTWYHPKGGHLFSIFLWAHLIFSEEVLCRWRRDFRADGAKRFADVDGGLNQMTIRKFDELVEAGSLYLERLHLRPIAVLRRAHNFWTRKWMTSVVDCVLRRA